MVKFYKVEKDGKETFKTTSLSMALEYRKSNGGVVTVSYTHLPLPTTPYV